MDIEKVRELFPITRERLYFDTASLSPYCLPVINALNNFILERRDSASLYYDEWYDRVEDLRCLAAELLSTQPGSIALTRNTTEGVNLTARLVDWQKGDEVLAFACDFPTNVMPFQNLSGQDVTTRLIECGDGIPMLDEIEDKISENTKLLTISHVFYNSGYKVDLARLSQLCRERGVLLHVDAAQSLGALEIDVERMGIDFLSAPGYKWLLSPLGTGIFYAKEEHLERTPTMGWLSVKEPKALKTKGYEIASEARKFEGGNQDLGGLMGMKAALELIFELRTERIESYVLEMSRTLEKRLSEEGFTVRSETADENRSGIVCIEKGSITREKLLENAFIATVRDKLRLSTHIFNTKEEIDNLVMRLSKIRQS